MALVNGGLGGGDVIPPQPSGGGAVDSVVAGAGIAVDDTVPASPVVSVAVNEWIPMDLINGWAAYAGPYAVPSYRLTPDGQHVELAGAASGGTPGYEMCILGAPYLPITDKAFPCLDLSSNAVIELSVNTSGYVGAASAIISASLDGIVYALDI